MKIPINKIKPDPKQPRKTFEGIEDLAGAIKKEIMLYPLIVDRNYKLIDGERRLRASKRLGLKKVEVIVLDIDVTDKQRRLILQLMADVHNHKLDILERDQAWLGLWNKMGKPTYKDLAITLGYKTKNAYYNVADAIERATFVPKQGDSITGKTPAHIITETKFLKDKPELREKAIKKIARVGPGETNRRSRDLMRKVKQAKTDKEIEKILDDPLTDYTYEADSVIRAIKIILDKLNKGLMLKIPKTQAVILSGYIVELQKHLKTWEAEEAEIV